MATTWDKNEQQQDTKNNDELYVDQREEDALEDVLKRLLGEAAIGLSRRNW